MYSASRAKPFGSTCWYWCVFSDCFCGVLVRAGGGTCLAAAGEAGGWSGTKTPPEEGRVLILWQATASRKDGPRRANIRRVWTILWKREKQGAIVSHVGVSD